MTPGKVAFVEEFSCTSLSNTLNVVSDWQNCIWEELMQTPVARQQELHKQSIDEILSKINSDTEEYFTSAEADPLKQKLAEIESQLNEKLNSLFTDLKELKKEKDLLHKDIDTLKSTSQVLTKGSWGKSLIIKMFKWGSKSENKQLLESGYEMVKGFIEQPPAI